MGLTVHPYNSYSRDGLWLKYLFELENEAYATLVVMTILEVIVPQDFKMAKEPGMPQ